MMETKLFVYGLLRPGQPNTPKTTSASALDCVIFADTTDLVEGFTLTIDEAELASLDEFESPEYKRVKVVTLKRHNAWAYELVKKESL